MSRKTETVSARSPARDPKPDLGLIVAGVVAIICAAMAWGLMPRRGGLPVTGRRWSRTVTIYRSSTHSDWGWRWGHPEAQDDMCLPKEDGRSRCHPHPCVTLRSILTPHPLRTCWDSCPVMRDWCRRTWEETTTVWGATVHGDWDQPRWPVRPSGLGGDALLPQEHTRRSEMYLLTLSRSHPIEVSEARFSSVRPGSMVVVRWNMFGYFELDGDVR